MRPLLALFIYLSLLIPSVARAEGDFKLTLSPIFINAVTDPGAMTSTTIKVTNGGDNEERLSVGVMKFRAFDDSGRPELLDMEEGDEYAKWVSFEPAELLLAPGKTGALTVKFNPPAEAALGYYYAIAFRRAGDPPKVEAKESQLLGTAAVLALLEVRSPEASRQVAAVQFSTDRRWYDFLPVNFHVKLQNTGNVHVASRGNIFIDRGGKKDIAILDVNKNYGNILPNSSRSFDATWSDGFPTRGDNGLVWSPTDLGKFRWGKYTAHLVMAYDDGQRDVPIEAAISFWVIPWQLILILAIVVLFMLVGVRSFWKGLRRRLRPKNDQPQ